MITPQWRGSVDNCRLLDQFTARIYCPAKLNLGLEVLERDPQTGYHRIATVLQAISLTDSLEVSLAAEGPWRMPLLLVEGPCAAEVPAENNSLLAAWALLQGGQAFPSLQVKLQKRIPTQSGLGGAGSDAVGMLLGLRELARQLCLAAGHGAEIPAGNPEAAAAPAHQLATLRAIAALPDAELAILAGRTGSDAPFFVQGGCQEARGRGEILRPLRRRLDFHLLLVVPQFGSATATAYAALGRGTQRREPLCMALAVKAIEAGDWLAFEAALVNDFEPALLARHSAYGAWYGQLQAAGARAVSLSGSGSSFYALFDQAQQAAAAGAALREANPDANFRYCGLATPLP